MVSTKAFAATGAIPVWPTESRMVYGRAFKPLYRSVPDAAQRDPGLYASLALFDMLRGGLIRERRFAERRVMEMMS